MVADWVKTEEKIPLPAISYLPSSARQIEDFDPLMDVLVNDPFPFLLPLSGSLPVATCITKKTTSGPARLVADLSTSISLIIIRGPFCAFSRQLVLIRTTHTDSRKRWKSFDRETPPKINIERATYPFPSILVASFLSLPPMLMLFFLRAAVAGGVVAAPGSDFFHIRRI